MTQIKILKSNLEISKNSNHLLSDEVLNVLPVNIKIIVENLPQDVKSSIEEIRIREGRPLMFCYDSGDFMVDHQGVPIKDLTKAYIIESNDLNKILHLLTRSSIYALEEEIKNGFITISGGHRVGLTGRVVLERGSIKTIRNITGLNIRILRDLSGIAEQVLPFLINKKDDWVYRSLIISPPQCGKTTLLRDLVRQLSNGVEKLKFYGKKIGLVDERSEIGGCYEGIPQLDIGIRTDILDACPKANGMMMLLRSMSPQVIVVDEIGREEDVFAIEEVINGGISLIATAHGANIDELKKRPSMNQLLAKNVFERLIVLGKSLGVGTLEQVIDLSNNHSLLSFPTLLRARGENLNC